MTPNPTEGKLTEAPLLEAAYGLSCYAAASRLENTPEFLAGLMELCEKFQADYKNLESLKAPAVTTGEDKP